MCCGVFSLTQPPWVRAQPPFLPAAPETPRGLHFFHEREQIEHLLSGARNEDVSSTRALQEATAEDTISQYDPRLGAVPRGDTVVGPQGEQGRARGGTTTLRSRVLGHIPGCGERTTHMGAGEDKAE